MNVKKITLVEAQEEYLKYLVNKGRKQRTIINHRSPIVALTRQMGNTYLHRITPDDFDILFGQSDWKPVTKNVYMTALKGFFTWAARRQYINPLMDPTMEFENLRVPKAKKVWIDPEDFPRLLQVAGEYHPRDRACVALGLFTFCRASEIANLRIADIDFKNNRVDIYRMKTEQHDILPLTSELRIEMVEWFNHYRRMMNTDFLDPRWYVIPRFGPMPMLKDPLTHRLAPNPGALMPLLPTKKTVQIYRPIKRAMKTLGYETSGQGMHSLRRSGAAAAVQQLRGEGYDRALGRVQAMLGHASVKTTEIYTGMNLDKLERDETWAGKPMFPNVFGKPGLEVIDGGESRAADV